MHKGTLERVSFLTYENFNNPDIAYSIFFSKFNCVINTIAPFKTVKNKKNASEWFDGKIAEKIHTRDKLYKNSNQQTCMLMKKYIKKSVTQFKI